VIARVDWINPHAYVYLDVTDADGSVTSWALDGVALLPARCSARVGPPGKIVQPPRELVFLYNGYHGGFFRVVPLDAPAEQPPRHLGYAVGRFDGDVLVVKTNRFTTETWLTDNGAFHRRSCASSSACAASATRSTTRPLPTTPPSWPSLGRRACRLCGGLPRSSTPRCPARIAICRS
jgi:hypothetical protein